MLKVINQVDFVTLYNNSWGQAVAILDEISHADKEYELMDLLEELYTDGADAIELNDLLTYEWQWVFSQIGMPIEDEEEED